MPKQVGFLSTEDYKTVLSCVPIPTVDFILVRQAPGGREFLLGKRTEEPYRGKWFVTGGRINKNEQMADAVCRQVQRELGITDGVITLVGCLDVMNPPKMGIPWHSIWHFHTIAVAPDAVITPNKENKKVKWFSHVNPRWPLPVRQALAMAGFSK